MEKGTVNLFDEAFVVLTVLVSRTASSGDPVKEVTEQIGWVHLDNGGTATREANPHGSFFL